MDSNRLIGIIILDLELDNSKAHHDLERIINSNNDCDELITKVKDKLREIVQTEAMLSKMKTFLEKGDAL